MKTPKIPVVVSTDPSQLNIPIMVEWILGSYWGKWQDVERIVHSFKSSLFFGLYIPVNHGPQPQIGFCRVVTDHATFSSITDMYVAEAFRGKGLGTHLLAEVVKHPSVGDTICIIASRDAQSWYKKFGWHRVGGDVMKRDPTPCQQ